MLKDISARIEEGTVTRDDINHLIETSYKSAQERILRRTRARDSNDGHDDEGHAGPARVAARTAPRRGGGRMNDPRRTARGRRAVTHQEGVIPRASFVSRRDYEPVCPHCGETMYEKHYVPDHVRNESGDVVSTTDLFRHRGDCYDKGPFAIEWPEQKGYVAVEGKYAEATRFILEHRGAPNPPLDEVSDPGSLKRLAARLLTVEDRDRDWLYDVYRRLED